MAIREINLETNNFEPSFSGEFIFDQMTKLFLNKVEIDLDELCAKYLLEEFDDISIITHYGQFNALNYLIENSSKFKFKGGHPGATADSRRENSRVLGQTICRYFIEKMFGIKFIANIGTLLGKELPPEFAHITVDRILEGDTPDYLFMDNNDQPCLAEAKGRRKAVVFLDNKFGDWRKQFERIEIKVNGNKTEVKGYITELVIANENNQLANSKLYIEDPTLAGQKYKDGNLEKLIKLAHYQRILSKTYFNFIGNALISNDRLPSNRTYSVSIYSTKSDNIHEIVPLYKFMSKRTLYPDIIFLGISFSVLKDLLSIARGNITQLDNYLKLEKFGSDLFQFQDGFIVCKSNQLNYLRMEEI